MDLWFDATLMAVGAMLIDRYVGDVSNRYHPLRWMGNILDALDRRVSDRESRWCILYGLLSYLAVLLLFGAAALAVCVLAKYGLSGVLEFEAFGRTGDLGEVLWVALSALFLKVTYSLFLFRKLCRPIEADLLRGDLDAAADKTQMMVNRRTRGMDREHIASSCCETISENLVDSVLSPLLYFGLLGLPGALIFRCANLMDAMWGRRDERYERLGKFPARLDDALGFLPSRLSPAFVWLAARLSRMESGGKAMAAARREHAKTPSPNSGWPMAASAAAMGVSFEKAGVYVMGEGPLPSIGDIAVCYRLIERASLLFLVIAVVPLAMLFGIHVQVAVEEFFGGLIGVC